MDKQHFKIIVTCRNAEKWIAKSIGSILRQDYPNYEAVVIDAKSEDNTFGILREYIPVSDKITVVQNETIQTAIVNNFEAIDIANPSDEDVLVFLDGDDWFYDSHTLEHLNEAYADPDVWITWGNYLMSTKKIYHGSRNIPADYNLRKERWVTCHLKTCKYFLWRNIADKDFRHTATGEYYTVCRDAAFMWPMLEMAGAEHWKFIDKILYVYNSANENSDYSIHKSQRKVCVRDMRNRPPYTAKTKEQLLKGESI